MCLRAARLTAWRTTDKLAFADALCELDYLQKINIGAQQATNQAVGDLAWASSVIAACEGLLHPTSALIEFTFY